MPTKKKKKTKKTKAQKQRSRRNAVITLGIVGVLALGGAGAVGVREVDIRARAILDTEPQAIVVNWPTIAGEPGEPAQTWMPASERARLESLTAGALLGGAPFDAAPLREASDALYRTGWFVTPPVVRRIGDGSVRVDGRWRIPAAVVRHGGRERLIAWDGVALPLEYAAGTSGVRYLANPVANPPRPPQPGEGFDPWPGQDVADGLKLLDLLDDDPHIIAQVSGIELGFAAGGLTIETDTGSRIRWGAGPDQFRPGEQNTQTKLTRIKALLDRTGRIDGGARSIEVFGPQLLLERD